MLAVVLGAVLANSLFDGRAITQTRVEEGWVKQRQALAESLERGELTSLDGREVALARHPRHRCVDVVDAPLSLAEGVGGAALRRLDHLHGVAHPVAEVCDELSRTPFADQAGASETLRADLIEGDKEVVASGDELRNELIRAVCHALRPLEPGVRGHEPFHALADEGDGDLFVALHDAAAHHDPVAESPVANAVPGVP